MSHRVEKFCICSIVNGILCQFQHMVYCTRHSRLAPLVSMQACQVWWCGNVWYPVVLALWCSMKAHGRWEMVVWPSCIATAQLYIVIWWSIPGRLSGTWWHIFCSIIWCSIPLIPLQSSILRKQPNFELYGKRWLLLPLSYLFIILRFHHRHY